MSGPEQAYRKQAYQEERRIADSTAEAYDAVYGSLLAYRERWERITGLVARYARPQDRLLEVGCGTATFLAHLRDRGFRALYGFDLSPRCLAVARRKVAEATLAAANMVRMPWRDSSFDLVVFMGSLHHLEDHSAAVAEGLRILRPGGYLMILEGEERFFHARPGIAVRVLYKMMRAKNASRRAAWPIDPARAEFYTEHHHQKREEEYLTALGPGVQHVQTHRFERWTASLEGVLFQDSCLDRCLYRLVRSLDDRLAVGRGVPAQMLIVARKESDRVPRLL